MARRTSIELSTALPLAVTLISCLIMAIQMAEGSFVLHRVWAPPRGLINGFVLGLGFAASVGPQILYLIRTGLARRHLRVVMATGVSSELALLLVSALASNVVAAGFAQARPYGIMLGTVFMVWCGFRLITQHNQHGIDHLSFRIEDRIHAIGHMLFVTWCNPLGYLKWAIFAGVLVALPSADDKLWCVAGLALASVLKFLIWPMAGRMLGRVLRHHGAVVWFNRVSGMALIGSAALTASQL